MAPIIYSTKNLLIGLTLLTTIFHQQFLEVYSLNNNQQQQHQHQFVSGVYVEEFPKPIFYETYIPIVFEYELPHWNASEVTFNNWYSCTSEIYPYKSCAVIFHLNKAISNLHVDFESLQPIQDTTFHLEYYRKLYQSFSFCDKIKKHFSGIFIQKREVDEYIQMLKECQSAGDEEQLNYIETSIADFNYSITQPFNRIEMNYYETFYKSINASLGLETVGTATLTNSRSTIQANLLTSYYAEKYRWIHALQDCQQGIIPHSLISSKKLIDTLQELAKKSNFNSNYEFSIPLDLISKYYSLPLADCTFTNNTFLVRILFPIKSKLIDVDKFSLIRIHPIQFNYKKKRCSVQMSSNNFIILHDSIPKLAYSTSCESNKLCHLSDLSWNNNNNNNNMNNADACVSSIFANNSTKFKANCKFLCFESEYYNDDTLVQRVGSNKLILTGRGGTSIAGGGNNNSFITKCQGSSFTNHELIGTGGATEITLPCKCQLILLGGNRKYSSTAPSCNENGTISIVQLEPWHFTKESKENGSILVNDKEVKERYIKYGANWVKEDQQQPIKSNDDACDSFTSHTILWVTFLSIFVLLLALQIYTLYKLRIMELSSCYYPTEEGVSRIGTLEPTTINNLLYYKVARAGNNRNDNDLEPEVHLLSNVQ